MIARSIPIILTAIWLIPHVATGLSPSLDPSPSITDDDDMIIMSPSPSDFTISTDGAGTSPTPTVPPTSPIDRHLSLIIGVPTGLVLSVLLLLGCVGYCGLSAFYKSWKDNRNQHDSGYKGSSAPTGATKTTKVKSANTPQASSVDYNSSSYYNASSFEPSADDTAGAQPHKPKEGDIAEEQM